MRIKLITITVIQYVDRYMHSKITIIQLRIITCFLCKELVYLCCVVKMGCVLWGVCMHTQKIKGNFLESLSLSTTDPNVEFRFLGLYSKHLSPLSPPPALFTVSTTVFMQILDILRLKAWTWWFPFYSSEIVFSSWQFKLSSHYDSALNFSSDLDYIQENIHIKRKPHRIHSPK